MILRKPTFAAVILRGLYSEPLGMRECRLPCKYEGTPLV